MKKSLIIIFISLTAFVGKANAQSPTKQETRAFLQNMLVRGEMSDWIIYDDGMKFKKENSCRDGNIYEKLILFKNITRVFFDGYSISFKGSFSINECGTNSQINELPIWQKYYENSPESKQIIKAIEHICKLNGAVIGDNNLFKD